MVSLVRRGGAQTATVNIVNIAQRHPLISAYLVWLLWFVYCCICID